MTEPIAYNTGKFVLQSELVVPPQDLGFMWGATVAEQLRTFRGELFELPSHLGRLKDSLSIVGVDLEVAAVEAAAREVVEHNFKLIDPSADLGLTIFVTPGLSATYADSSEQQPFVGIHSYPLRFSLWAEKYSTGQACELATIPQVAKECWPRRLKSRSRMHYYLADKAAKAKDPNARAILLDDHGNVNEASTANVVAYFEGEGFVSPPREDILLGISLGFLESLAVQEPGFSFRQLAPAELQNADEVLLTSTPFCLLPVSSLGEVKFEKRSAFDAAMKAWSEAVSIDIIEQAKRHS